MQRRAFRGDSLAFGGNVRGADIRSRGGDRLREPTHTDGVSVRVELSGGGCGRRGPPARLDITAVGREKTVAGDRLYRAHCRWREPGYRSHDRDRRNNRVESRMLGATLDYLARNPDYFVHNVYAVLRRAA